MPAATKEVTVTLRNPNQHPNQKLLVESTKKRIVAKAGRRGGKTVGASIKAVKAFLSGRRVLYAAPTAEQTDKFWFEVKKALKGCVDARVFKQNDSEQFIEKPNSENRIKAKTAWNANTLRGDYADLLILDEFQLMNEDAWDEVGAPMLLDNNGDAVFIFTPPSLKSEGVSKAKDPRHASKLYKKALQDATGLWQAIHFTSFDNPFISKEALGLIAQDMSMEAYRREIMAQDDEIETSWLVHAKFNEGVCKIKRFQIPDNWDVMTGHDFGIANPAALFLARVKLPLPPGAPPYMRLNDLVAWKEYCPGAGYSTAQHVEAFKEVIRLPENKARNIVKRVGGNQTTEDETRQGYGAHGWPITAPSIGKVNAQLDRVIAIEELNKFYVFEDLYQTLTEMANCMWELDDENKPTKGKIKDEAKYHLLACLRYILSDFTPETVVSTGNKIAHVAY